mgnify:CR=1 FL=1
MNVGQELLFLEQSNAIEAEYDAQALLDAFSAWQYIRRHRTLNLWNIRNTHYRLMQSRTTIGKTDIGAFRTEAVWIAGREAIHWANIKPMLEEWCDDLNTLLKGARDATMDEERVKQFHVRYEKIHPFLDGNGRTGRIFMNWQRLRIGMPLHIIHTGREQQEYYLWFSRI